MKNQINREKILALIREFLHGEKEIIFAYAYGSFLKDKEFRDIDLGIFLKNAGENPYVITSQIKVALSQQAKKQGLYLPPDCWDVQIINQAPFTFLGRIFKEGKLLLDRNPDLRTDIIEKVSLKYRECAGLLAEAALL